VIWSTTGLLIFSMCFGGHLVRGYIDFIRILGEIRGTIVQITDNAPEITLRGVQDALIILILCMLLFTMVPNLRAQISIWAKSTLTRLFGGRQLGNHQMSNSDNHNNSDNNQSSDNHGNSDSNNSNYNRSDDVQQPLRKEKLPPPEQENPAKETLKNLARKEIQEQIREILKKEFKEVNQLAIGATTTTSLNEEVVAESQEEKNPEKELRETLESLRGEVRQVRDESEFRFGFFANYLEGILEYLKREEIKDDEEEMEEKFMKINIDKRTKGKEEKRGKLMSNFQDIKPKVTFENLSDEEDEPAREKERNEKEIFQRRERTVGIFPAGVAGKETNKGKGKDKKRKIEETNQPEENLEEQQTVTQENTIESLQQQINEMKEAMKKQKEEQKKLTEQEKELTKGELERKWQEERYVKRFGPREELNLTEEEKQMSRQDLYRKFVQERRDRWLQRQQEMGIELYQCPTCFRYEKKGVEHVCLRAPMRGPLQRRGGVPVHEQLIVEGTTVGLNIRKQTVVDIERLKKEHAALTKAIEELQPVKTTMDVVMQEAATSSTATATATSSNPTRTF
jgi:hypothetical protein